MVSVAEFITVRFQRYLAAGELHKRRVSVAEFITVRFQQCGYRPLLSRKLVSVAEFITVRFQRPALSVRGATGQMFQ